jgi:peptidoglycan/LPS O-acetylase OafA/YrhL
VLALLRRPRFGKTTALIIGIFVLGLSLRTFIYLHQLKPLQVSGDEDSFLLSYVEKIYYPTFTRLDGLLVGVTMAVIRTFRPNWWQEMMGRGRTLLALGIILSGFAMWLFQDRFSFSGTVAGFPLLSLGLGFLITASVSPTCQLSRVRGFGSVAALAYSLYLTHKEIAHLDRLYFGAYMRNGGWEPFFIAFGTSFAAAALLYSFVERPFLRLRERFQNHKPEAAFGLAAAK